MPTLTNSNTRAPLSPHIAKTREQQAFVPRHVSPPSQNIPPYSAFESPCQSRKRLGMSQPDSCANLQNGSPSFSYYQNASPFSSTMPPPTPKLMTIPLPPQSPYYTPTQGSHDPFVAINPYLEFTGRHLHLMVDLSQPGHSVQEPLNHRGALLQAATYPGLPSLAIISELLPKPIVVHRSNIDPRWVTVADVLGTLCEVLRQEMDDENRHPESYPSPCLLDSRVPLPGGRKRSRRRKIDYLNGRNRFMGLSYVDLGAETFALNVGL